MATLHISAIYCLARRSPSGILDRFRRFPAALAHLMVMDTHDPSPQFADGSQIEHIVSLSELCEHLHVRVQTIYDLRSQGRGPRGFRVGRELRFRVSEVEAWLARLEQDDLHSDLTGRP